MDVKKIYQNYQKIKDYIIIKGWINQIRRSKKIVFISLNDGTNFEDIQIIFKNDIELIDEARKGAAIKILGKVVITEKRIQPFEVEAKTIEILKNVDEDYPIQKKAISREYLRNIPHLRHRTKIFQTIMRIRSTLALKIHDFFNKENFLYMHSPIITSNDGEGAGEIFDITSKEDKNFFNSKAMLGVTGQLHAESYAIGFKKVYTFGPTFRAEKSHTQKHAAEFWMIEPEVAFYNLERIIKLAWRMLKYVISQTLELHPKEFEFFKKNVDEKIIDKLNLFLKKDVQIITYENVIKELDKVKNNFDFKDIHFGMDLKTEHEKYIAHKIFNGPVAVINYPKEIKAFYMHQNDDDKTVAAFDLLIPSVGELIGGSQRETNINKLKKRMKELNIDQKEFQWYLDLRRFGDAMSSGFGLGFERLVMYVTGIENIRDVIPYPRTHNKLMM